MATSLRLEDRLDGAWKFVPWKARIVLILEESEPMHEVVHSTHANPIQFHASADAQALEDFNKTDFKTRWIILDAINANVILWLSHIS